MRLIAFSDLHSDEHDDFSYQLPNGLNSRLVDCIDVLDKVAYYRDKYECDLVLNAGDTFHIPQVMTTVVFQETYRRLAQLGTYSRQMITLAGNHDMASITADGIPVSTVYAIQEIDNTFLAAGEHSTFPSFDDVRIHCIPYIKDESKLDKSVEEIGARIAKLPKWRHIIVTHIGLDQATNGPNEIHLKNSYAISKLRKLGAQKILSGHHHHPEDHGDWSVIGAPLQMNMNDIGDRRGLLIYDTDKDTVKRIWLRGSRFFKVEIEQFKDYEKLQRLTDAGAYDGGYVLVLLTQGVVEETKIRDLLTPRVKMYKIVPMRNIKSSVRSEAVSKKAIASVGNLSEVIPDYVATVKAPGLRSKRLITVGRKLVKE